MVDILKCAVTINIGAKKYLSFTIKNIDQKNICNKLELIKNQIINKIEDFSK